MKAYYNEIDPFAAAWLRELIKAGHIAQGDVDERDIRDVRPGELAGYTQCHFFAGIGVWSYALRRAGWDDSRPVWTGSCPCQSFSAAGKGAGFADERHLWPAWFHLISECRPDVIFGEQVEAAIRHSWLDLVQTDLEGIGYACGAYGLPAAGFGAPHIRQRLYFVADSADERYRSERDDARGRGESGGGCVVGDAEQPGLEGLAGHGDNGGRSGRQRADTAGPVAEASEPRATNGFWSDAEWIACRDGKSRPTQPGVAPLVNGAVNRVGRLRGYGNAICAPVAEEFIRAYLAREG